MTSQRPAEPPAVGRPRDGRVVDVRVGLSGSRAKRSVERLADEDALARHFHAFPVGLDQRLALEVMTDDDGRMRELLEKVAGLRHRSVAAGRARFEPAQRAHLAAFRERSAGRREVIADGAGCELQTVEPVDPRLADEVEQDVVLVPQRVRTHAPHVQARPEHRFHELVPAAAHVARGFGARQQVGGARWRRPVRRDTPVDERLRLVERDGGDGHRRSHVQPREGQGHGRVEIRARPRELASVGAQRRIESEGERGRDRHARDPVRGCPRERIRLHAGPCLLVDARLDSLELGLHEPRPPGREADPDHVLERNAPALRVVLADSHAQRILRIDDDCQLRAVEGVGGIGERDDAADGQMPKSGKAALAGRGRRRARRASRSSGRTRRRSRRPPRSPRRRGSLPGGGAS